MEFFPQSDDVVVSQSLISTVRFHYILMFPLLLFGKELGEGKGCHSKGGGWGGVSFQGGGGWEGCHSRGGGGGWEGVSFQV